MVGDQEGVGLPWVGQRVVVVVGWVEQVLPLEVELEEVDLQLYL